ncbi:MAG: CBS domain-containing protein [Deltaproteobacteria bacterium]|nr:CBS domain-containing protein [Deltaproteobacteria bacterium]
MRRLQRTIEQIGWSRDVPKLKATDTVAVAFAAMSREVHDCILVVDGGELAGIFTSRDFLNRVAAVRADPAALALGAVMTPSPRALRPRDPVSFAINWMAVEGFRNVPIVDDLGTVLGVLTVWDVMRHLGEMFDEIDATPRLVAQRGDTSSIVSMVDLGGDQ